MQLEDERYPDIVSSTGKKEKQRLEKLAQKRERQVQKEAQKGDSQQKDPGRWRDLTAFFFLGICNNFGFNVILTAAHDIITVLGKDEVKPDSFVRECNHMSTGAILLADVIPALIIKVLIPFVAGYTNIKIACTIVITAISFLMLALASSEALAIFAVITTSFAYGLGEATLLGHTSHYDKLVVSTWSSGTGASALLSSLAYSTLRQFKVGSDKIILWMILVPCLEIFVFWILLRRPKKDTAGTSSCGKGIVNEVFTIEPETSTEGHSGDSQSVQVVNTTKIPETIKDVERNSEEDGAKFVSVSDKLKFLPYLIRMYMAPLLFIYFAQYFINQGLLELIYFKDIPITRPAQYRWFQVTYQVSVFISRSSVNFFQFPYIWLLAALQVFNMVYFSLEAVYFFTPNIYIIFGLIFWEGLVGGSAYVNTFYRIRTEVPPEKRPFAMGITTFADSPGITLAGLAAMPVHDFICNLPIPTRISTMVDVVGCI